MGFIRDQEEQLAMRLLIMKYRRSSLPVPEISELKSQSAQIVDDAHRIARERGRNILSIMKEMIEGVKKQ